MSFPYSYKSDFEINQLIDKEKFIHLLEKNFLAKNIILISKNHNCLVFKSKNSIFGFSYELKITLNDEDSYIIGYSYEMQAILRISLAIMVIIAFFSQTSFRRFIIVAALFIPIIYAVNILYINSFIEKILQLTAKSTEVRLENTELEVLQESWLNDQNKCPACGCDITIYDYYCPSCGLKLQSKKIKPPINTTAYNDKQFTYNYKKKDDTN